MVVSNVEYYLYVFPKPKTSKTNIKHKIVNIYIYTYIHKRVLKKTFITLIFHEIFRILYSLHKRSPKRMVLI